MTIASLAANTAAANTPASAQRYARIAGVLFLFTMLGGFFGEMYVPGRLLVSSDAEATARNILSSHLLFRAGFAAYLV